MVDPLLEAAARAVLGRYGLAPPTDRAVFLGNHGGFSGARLWKVDTERGSFCLRAWPPGATGRVRLNEIHRLMVAARRAGLEFVPAVAGTADRQTWVEEAGRWWDLQTWLPGRADFHARPARERLEAACVALARLHGAWHVPGGRGACPAVRRRLDCLREWAALVKSGWRPACEDAADAVAPWAERAWRLVQHHAERVPKSLLPWASRPLALQPCLCDVWHDHVLFEGDTLSGLVDYGSVKRDHVAVDLARLLGSLVGDDPGAMAAGLSAYARLRPLSVEEHELVTALDETGTLLAVANWLKWLYRDGRPFEDRAAVARRLAALVERIEKWRF